MLQKSYHFSKKVVFSNETIVVPKAGEFSPSIQTVLVGKNLQVNVKKRCFGVLSKNQANRKTPSLSDR